ncbi:putative anthocyanidin 3-O-glucosyltransferase [Helianthus annuus]|uniref:Glycosyltransferase n=1 Tax=Helianthus annuus TaxID=4232 RepID=A0A251TFT4_HELAN|nr:UDP-glycosyltransferase 79A2 [Helianthus annuus]KAF5784730.1 putative anthocyanidin 3-O-glucosyltransferase [Helianthus annuus]KAJ0528514.1 putative anthocyanidin 3-O-glucosyltransferase [Helianthus annuus]KAJ0698896.1 putative anthocyanidin 3-O-glucosyltransferase [Helianthus annuus]KAJ0877822.1 putative anthocyanidin 3-O-glucosyltransferase [Helianthus annuus]
MASSGKTKELHLVMFPFFAFGHISPFVQLSNKLSSYPGIKISFLAASTSVGRIETMLNSTASTTVIPLTLPHVDGLPEGVENTSDTSPETAELLKVALDLMRPQIKTLLTNLKPNFMFFDFAQGWLPEIACDLGIKSIFFTVFMTISKAFVTSWFAHDTPPTIDQLKKPPALHPITLKTFQAQDLMYIFMSFHGTPSVFDRLIKCFNGCNAVLIKSCREMEGPYIEYVSNQVKKPVLLIGPVVPDPHSGELDETWDNWLSQFPAKSVIYCSFGSETFLTDDQIKELSLGLELTGLPFLLVLNFPANVDSSTELKRTLPEGFVDRVKGRGVVHSGWVQQRHILAHESVGCYVCHAGFSSVVEGLVNDCQLVMIPLKGDQFLNSKLIALEWKAGVEVNRRDEDGFFGKDDVFEAVKSVMKDSEKEPAKSIRENQKKWKEFLQDDEIHNKYVADFVEGLKAL